MEEPEYHQVQAWNSEISCEVNPSYAVVSHNKRNIGSSYSHLDPVEPGAKKPSRDWSCWCLVGLLLVGVVACVSMAVAVWSIAKVNSIDRKCMHTTAVQALEDKVEELNATLNAVVDMRHSELGAFMEALSGQFPAFPADSCSIISLRFPPTPSGLYWVRASDGSAVHVYCDMTRSCGGVTGGWMRVASLDFGNSSTPCPSGLQEHNDSSIRTCGIQFSNGSCASVLFGTSGIEYNMICGKVIAYQYGTTGAFHDSTNLTIDSNYVDGVSLTHGSNPREHIWTFAAALDEYGSRRGVDVCECSHSGRDGGSSPAFVGQDYFCDSGVPRRYTFSFNIFRRGRFFPTSPLWDGSGCGPDSTCCSFNSPPWFYKQLPSPTSDAIEMRACTDEGRPNKDVALSSVEIFVQ